MSMLTAAKLVKFLADREKQMREFLQSHVVDDEPAPEPPASEPRKLRQSEQPGVDMARMGKAAQRQRQSERLPRTPEEARRRRPF